MKKTLSIVLCVLLVLLAVACSPETKQHEHKYEKVAEKSYVATCKSTGLDVFSCTECGDTYSVTLPLTDHSHAEDAEPTYSKETDKPNCIKTGLGSYTCQYCGGTFSEVVPKDSDTHAYYDEKTKTYIKMSSFDEAHMEWSDSAEIEKTYFAPALKVAICNECGGIVENIYKPVESANKKYEYSQIVGTWIYKDLENDISYYFDVKEDQDKGTVTSECTKMTFGTSGTYVTQPVAGITSFAYDGAYRTLSIYTDSKYFLISAKPGTNKTKLYCDGDINLEDESVAAVQFRENHNHFYGSTETEDDYIEKDSKFSGMKFLDVRLCNDTNHYLECSECGLSFIESSHEYPSSGNTDICKYCGFDKNSSKGFVEVTVNRANDPNTFKAAKQAAETAIADALALYEEYNTESTNTDAETFLSSAVTYATAAKTAMETYKLTEDTSYETLVSLLEDSSGSTGNGNTNLYHNFSKS